MTPKRVLSLDMSSKTGWALIVSDDKGISLEEYGMIQKTAEPEGQYPANYVDWAYQVFGEIDQLIDHLHPDVLVIEETVAGSKNVYSQKILEWIHFLVAKMIKESKIEAVYMLTGSWRAETGCLMSNEEKKKNKAVREYKKKIEKETGTKPTVAYDINGKRIGLVGKKHVNVRRANEVFGAFLREPLRKKDEDEADALMLAYCYHLRRTKNL
jgi:Holliday junction resolvasome RuvABC endonuclease subunit